MVYSQNLHCYKNSEFIDIIRNKQRPLESTRAPVFLVLQEKLMIKDTSLMSLNVACTMNVDIVHIKETAVIMSNSKKIGGQTCTSLEDKIEMISIASKKDEKEGCEAILYSNNDDKKNDEEKKVYEEII